MHSSEDLLNKDRIMGTQGCHFEMRNYNFNNYLSFSLFLLFKRIPIVNVFVILLLINISSVTQINIFL